jgi:class 3 adenylate cyclase
MPMQIVPMNEAGRLESLQQYGILDTPPEFAYDAITEIAAQICECPVAVMGFIDDRRDWLKSKYGLPADFVECPRDAVVCSTTISMNDILCVQDLSQDERFQSLPIVAGEPYMRFYCGMPLINAEGYALGTLCVLDFVPRELSPSQREAVRRLALQTMAQLELRHQLRQRDHLVEELSAARSALAAEKATSETLLHTILPPGVAQELKIHGRVTPRYYESVSILFADFKGFTRLTEGLEPARLIEQLDHNFRAFDDIAEQNRLEALKTVGDAYMGAGGLPEPNRTHAIDACLCALQMQQFIARANEQRSRLRLSPWLLRIGVNTGSVIAGVVGKRRVSFDAWGDAVNMAERFEATAEPGTINIGPGTAHHARHCFEVEARGSVEVKHKGMTPVHVLKRIKPEFSQNSEGTRPNAEFWRAAGASVGDV